MTLREERRTRRSDVLKDALQLQLLSSAERTGARAMVLADQQGLVIAQSHAALPAAAEVAAYSPRLAPLGRWVGTLTCESGAENVAIAPFRLGKETAYLCALGLRSSKDLPSWIETRDGCRRILA